MAGPARTRCRLLRELDHSGGRAEPRKLFLGFQKPSRSAPTLGTRLAFSVSSSSDPRLSALLVADRATLQVIALDAVPELLQVGN